MRVRNPAPIINQDSESFELLYNQLLSRWLNNKCLKFFLLGQEFMAEQIEDLVKL